MKRIIITGATGFIGRHVLRELAGRDYDVHAIGRYPVDDGHASWHHCDLLTPGAAAPLLRSLRADYLLHLAWNATPGSFWSAPDNLDWVAATLQLFRAFAEAGGRRAVFAGTCAEYDWSFDLLTEDETPLRPRTRYGRAKRAAGELLLDAGAAEGVSVAWGRIFSVYGPGEPPGRVVSDLIARLLAGRPAACTDGRQERDFIQVKDVARALADILAGDFCGNVNIASGDCRPVASVIEEVGRQIGRPELIRFGAIALSSDEPRRLAAGMERLRDLIGFEPKFGLVDGVADTISAFRAGMAANSSG
jgi:nucleoside-diphosphate-sugar epimerase